jgi:hypothetical protein
LLSTGNCFVQQLIDSPKALLSNSNSDAKEDSNVVDGSGILNFGNVKVGKRKVEMSGPAAALVQKRMAERLRRNEL